MQDHRIPGTVWQRRDKDGNLTDRWTGQLPDSRGRGSKTFDSEAEANQWLLLEDSRYNLGIIVGTGVTAVGTTLTDLIGQWLGDHAMEDTTRTGYRILIDRFIVGSDIGGMPMSDLRPLHVTMLVKSTPMNWTRKQFAKILRTFFKWAAANDFTGKDLYVQSDVDQVLKKLRPVLQEKRRPETDAVWEPKEFRRLLEHESDPVYRDVWCFYACTGGRRGEGVGLRRSALFLDEGWCWVQDNVTPVGDELFHQKRPKNGARRKAFLAPTMVELLGLRLADQDAYRQRSATWVKDDYVFDRRQGRSRKRLLTPGTHLLPQTVTQRFNRLTKQCGLPLIGGPHGLRRTYATIIDDAGYTKRERQAAMGHTPDYVDNYVKVLEAKLREIANVVTRTLFDL